MIGGPEAKHILGVNPQFSLRARMPTKISLHLKLNRRAAKVGLILLSAKNRVMILDDDITLDAYMGQGDTATLEYNVRDEDRDRLVLMPLSTEEASFSLTIHSEIRVEVEQLPEHGPPPSGPPRTASGFNDASAEILHPVGSGPPLSSVYNSGYRVELPPDPRLDQGRHFAPAVHSLPEPGHESRPKPHELPHDASAIQRMENEIRNLREVVYKQSELLGDLARTMKLQSDRGDPNESRRWFNKGNSSRTAPENRDREQHDQRSSGQHHTHDKNEDSRHGGTPAPSKGSKTCTIS